MEKSMIEKIIKGLIVKQDYILLGDSDGQVSIRPGCNILLKQNTQPMSYVQIIDGHFCPLSFIQQRLESKDSLLEHLNEKGKSPSAYMIFIFERGIEREEDKEKESLIKAWQEKHLTERGNFKCFIVDGREKKVLKLFSRATNDKGISKLLTHLINTEDSQPWEEQSVESIVAQKKKDYEMSFKVKKPIVTYILIAINILVFIALSLYGQMTNTAMMSSS